MLDGSFNQVADQLSFTGSGMGSTTFILIFQFQTVNENQPNLGPKTKTRINRKIKFYHRKQTKFRPLTVNENKPNFGPNPKTKINQISVSNRKQK